MLTTTPAAPDVSRHRPALRSARIARSRALAEQPVEDLLAEHSQRFLHGVRLETLRMACASRFSRMPSHEGAGVCGCAPPVLFTPIACVTRGRRGVAVVSLAFGCGGSLFWKPRSFWATNTNRFGEIPRKAASLWIRPAVLPSGSMPRTSRTDEGVRSRIELRLLRANSSACVSRRSREASDLRAAGCATQLSAAERQDLRWLHALTTRRRKSAEGAHSGRWPSAAATRSSRRQT